MEGAKKGVQIEYQMIEPLNKTEKEEDKDK